MRRPGLARTSVDVVDLMRALHARALSSLANDVARAHHVTVEEMLGRSHGRSPSRARHALCRELRALGMSYPEIGRLVGRDHTSAMAACRVAA